MWTYVIVTGIVVIGLFVLFNHWLDKRYDRRTASLVSGIGNL